MADLKMTAKRVAELEGAQLAIAMQALARTVYPERQVAIVVPHIVLMWPASTVPKGRIDYTPAECFDPANNSEQFVEVLAWFISKDNSNELDGAVVRFYPDPDPNSPCRVIEHNGTPADLRRAVVEAAIRVANA